MCCCLWNLTWSVLLDLLFDSYASRIGCWIFWFIPVLLTYNGTKRESALHSCTPIVNLFLGLFRVVLYVQIVRRLLQSRMQIFADNVTIMISAKARLILYQQFCFSAVHVSGNAWAPPTLYLDKVSWWQDYHVTMYISDLWLKQSSICIVGRSFRRINSTFRVSKANWTGDNLLSHNLLKYTNWMPCDGLHLTQLEDSLQLSVNNARNSDTQPFVGRWPREKYIAWQHHVGRYRSESTLRRVE